MVRNNVDTLTAQTAVNKPVDNSIASVDEYFNGQWQFNVAELDRHFVAGLFTYNLHLELMSKSPTVVPFRYVHKAY